MSNVSSSHIIEAFSNKSKALSGQRLAVISYKTRKDGTKENDSQCVSVPMVADVTEQQMIAFKPYILGMIEDTQDKIVRALIAEGAKLVNDADITIDAVLAYLDDESKGSRLTKDVITEWFNASVADVLTVAIADKLGFSDVPTEGQTKQLNQQINVYREKFASLAGGKTSFAPDVATKLQKVLELTNDDDAMAVRFNARLEKMKVAASVDMMGL
jgi:plasmid maintenance system antidote protein VapI